MGRYGEVNVAVEEGGGRMKRVYPRHHTKWKIHLYGVCNTHLMVVIDNSHMHNIHLYMLLA